MQEDADNAAEAIAEKAGEKFPMVEFEIVDGYESQLMQYEDGGEELLAEVQQYINDNWADWV